MDPMGYMCMFFGLLVISRKTSEELCGGYKSPRSHLHATHPKTKIELPETKSWSVYISWNLPIPSLPDQDIQIQKIPASKRQNLDSYRWKKLGIEDAEAPWHCPKFWLIFVSFVWEVKAKEYHLVVFIAHSAKQTVVFFLRCIWVFP